ncbi:hypothetical protein O0L34_g6136 [Tuta absoluta]|nr:hypothetical protein O0L34_g6136 [Tuta absoluta]
MERSVSPKKKLKSPVIVDPTANLNLKTSITCANVPEGLFDTSSAKKHFMKFGRVQKIRLFPKKQMCIVEYDQPLSAERAVLNAGAFDGFMFDVTRTKARVRKRSKKDGDPDWVPDSDVEEELSAMSGAPTYRITRKSMDIDEAASLKQPIKTFKRTIKQAPPKQTVKAKLPVKEVKPIVSQPASGRESPVSVPVTQTSMSTAEAAAELNQLRTKVSLTPDEQWRILDARDRILRAWGGAGSRVKIGGATIGTCPDMCPEKELLHRQAEHQVMTLETVPDSDGQLEPWRCVKQYSRSSADQEIPMCYELRPARVLMRTTAYLLHQIADTPRPVSLADWFHFMWDRLRGIRKDITQQALCCAESIRLVEMCARFHAHCAARLADLEHTQFDQRLNTDNLTKCLQTLKHMYADAGKEMKPCEAEFRGYIALLNLGDANFWWEIKQLPLETQKSPPIIFAIKVFNALDNNNYVRFFRLVRTEATYLQACILLRYFNDVRARALARVVKAFAPRGGSRYPAEELTNYLGFESMENMKSFITHYGLRFAKDESELCIILDRNQFYEDSDPYPVARAVQLIESKRNCSVAEVIAGGALPPYDSTAKKVNTSFNRDGRLKETALLAEDQGYDTKNDSNKDVKALKSEILRLAQGGRVNNNVERISETTSTLFAKPDMIRTLSPGRPSQPFTSPTRDNSPNKSFSFKPAIPIAPKDVIKTSPEKIFGAETKSLFSFSKPQDTGVTNNLFLGKDAGNVFKSAGNTVFGSKSAQDNTLFGRKSNENKDPLANGPNLFKKPEETTVFKKSEIGGKTIFVGQFNTDTKNVDVNKNIFAAASNQNAFGNNIFSKAANSQDDSKNPSAIFGTFNKPANVFANTNNLFTQPNQTENQSKSVFKSNGDISPGTLFKSAINSEAKPYSIFQSKNKTSSVADNIFNSVNVPQSEVYEFDQTDESNEEQIKQQRLEEERVRREMERRIQEEIQEKEEQKRRELELKRREEEKRKEEEKRRQEELKQLEEKRRKEEERRQEELRKRLEEERKAEMKRKAEEEEMKFKERVENESAELIDELINEVREETVKESLNVEMEKMRNLIAASGILLEEICKELCEEVVYSEVIAEKYRSDKLKRKWFDVWKNQFKRNFKRRRLLDDTPVWLSENTYIEEAHRLRRSVENVALKNMNAIHRGYKFVGELKQLPAPEPYNIMEIIRSRLLKRMKEINYPYDKCFFWKVTLVSPGEMKWLCRKIEIEKWLNDAFSDKKQHCTSESLIHVQKQSWNHLMDFATSVSLTSPQKKNNYSDAMEGTNGILYYVTENDYNFINTLEESLKQKYPYQHIPVSIIMPKMEDSSALSAIQVSLDNLVNRNVVSCYRIFMVESQNIAESLNATTKSALKWLAKKCPPVPPMEVDYLKSICQRYLGNEIWYKLKSEQDGRITTIQKDLQKLVSCYNAAVDKLTDAITNENLFNYPGFPLEFNEYLDHTSPYPKPYEFVPTNARNSDNTSSIKEIMKKLKLPYPTVKFQPIDVASMQSQMRKYCKQIGWFEDPEQVVCKIVAKLPTQFADIDMPCERFSELFEYYDLIDFLNILVYEKICGLKNFDNRFAVYERLSMEEYRNFHWLYEIDVINKMKHKPLEYEDDLDMYIEAKRRKIDSMEYLMLENNDCTMVEENIKVANESISKISNCKKAVEQLEEQIDLERKKSMELEMLLQSALSNV